MTQIKSEATQESVTTATKVEMLYCIDCEQMVESGEFHEINNGGEITNCFFPLGIAFCPPLFHPEAIEVGEEFFWGDWAAQPEEDEFCPDEVGMWED